MHSPDIGVHGMCIARAPCYLIERYERTRVAAHREKAKLVHLSAVGLRNDKAAA